MTNEEMTEIVTNAVARAMEKERSEFWISQPQHYIDHQMMAACRLSQPEWVKNHEFISSVRAGASISQKVGITIIAGAFITFVGKAIWLAITSAIK